MTQRYKLIIFDVEGTLIHGGKRTIEFALINFIKQLRNSGYHIVLASNMSRINLNAIIRGNQLETVIDDSFSLTESRPKPDPEMLETAMLYHSATPHETLMVGDSDSDGYAAKNAGCDFVQIGAWHDPLLSPAHVIKSPQNIAQALAAMLL